MTASFASDPRLFAAPSDPPASRRRLRLLDHYLREQREAPRADERSLSVHPPHGPRQFQPVAAAALGIAPDSSVIIESRRGEMTARAFVTNAVQPKQVFVPMHFAGTNQLTLASFDRRSRQPSYKACAVSVRRDAMEEPG